MFSKIHLLFLATLACVNCEPPINTDYGTPLAAPISSYGTPNYQANNHDHHDYGEPKAYEFGYQVKDDYTGNNYNRQEQSDGNQVRGEYRVQLPDGRTQIVTYWADWQSGFHADVRYEGTAQYPDQYKTNNGGYNYNNNQGGYNTNQYNNGYNNGGFTNAGYDASGHYGAPSQQSNNFNYNSNYNNNYNNNGGYNGAATSSVTIKDYSQNSNGYNYDSYNNGYNKQRPSNEYGAP